MPHRYAGASGGQKRLLDSLELELYLILSHLAWVLGTKPKSFATVMLLASRPPNNPINYFINEEMTAVGIFQGPSILEVLTNVWFLEMI